MSELPSKRYVFVDQAWFEKLEGYLKSYERWVEDSGKINLVLRTEDGFKIVFVLDDLPPKNG